MCAARLGSVEPLEARVLFSAGDLDSLFAGGKVIRDIAGDDDFGFAIAVQLDGKVLLAGRAQSGGIRGNDFAVIRLNVNGSADTTFGSGGVVVTDLGSASDSAYAIAVQADGKIVVAGETTRVGTSSDFALVRYNSNGSLDTTFGTGGKVVSDVGGSTDQALSLALRADGRILVAGWASVGSLPRFAVVQYTTAGALDSTFGAGGKATTAYSPGYARGQAVALLGDGSIVVAGNTVNFSTGATDFAAVHYSSTGTVDSSFGSAGWATVDMGGDEIAHSVLVQGDGKIILAGEYSNNDTGAADFALARLTTAGTLDTTFGSSGTTLTDFDSDYDQGTSAALQSDGKIIVAGLATVGGVMGFGMARYDSGGNLDTTFAGGKFLISIGDSACANGVAVDNLGRIVLGGYSMDSAGMYDFAAARVIGHVNVAPTAAPGSGYTVNAGSSIQLDGSSSIDPDGSIASYEWDFNYDGATFSADATGAKPTFSAAGLSGPLTRTVALRVTDNNGASTIATTTVTIRALISPTANPGGSYFVIAGASVGLDGSASFDPDGSITLYQWDFDYDGTNFTVDATGAKPTFSATSLTASTTRTVALRVTDNDGLTGTATTSVSIHALIAPLANPGGPYTVTAGGSVLLDGSASSDSDGTISKFEWDLDYDGTTFTADATGTKPTFSAAGLTGSSTRTIALRVTDNDGLTSTVATTVKINAVVVIPPDPPPPTPTTDEITLQSDPKNPGKKILILHGTAKGDNIFFCSTRTGIEVRLNRKVLGRFANISRIVAYGEAGNDIINAGCADVPVALFGGAGNDRLVGSRFNDILCGGDGDDNLFGNRGNDLIVGGMGKDDLHSHFGDDKLIGGALTIESSLDQLTSLLTSSKIDSAIVIDDHAVDHLHGTPGADLLLLGVGDKLDRLR